MRQMLVESKHLMAAEKDLWDVEMEKLKADYENKREVLEEKAEVKLSIKQKKL